MKVENIIEAELYKKLIDYAFQKCDCILMKKYCDQHLKEQKRLTEIITSYSDYTFDKIINNYSEDFLEKAYNFFKDNNLIFDEAYVQFYESNKFVSLDIFESFKEFNRRMTIIGTIDRLFYDYNIDTWKKLNKDNIKKETRTFFENMPYQDYYFLNINSQTRKMLSEKENLYSWIYPSSIEDLCFLKNGHYWLESVAHEKLCFIYCKDEAEYGYLKSIGIVFDEDHFVPSEYICEEY